MILMALGTFAIGLIPAYERIGIWAPVLLLLARVVQGFPPAANMAARPPSSPSIPPTATAA
jgi:MHS family proline/betaine transporter-like MFS transporter